MLLSIENLAVSYEKIKALHGLSFQVDEGEIVCIIGANGAAALTGPGGKALRAQSLRNRKLKGLHTTLPSKKPDPSNSIWGRPW